MLVLHQAWIFFPNVKNLVISRLLNTCCVMLNIPIATSDWLFQNYRIAYNRASPTIDRP